MSHLPVNYSRNMCHVKAIQDVLWSEIPVNDHLASPLEIRNDGGGNGLKLG